MSCNLTKGFTLDCKEAVGGIKDIYLGNLNDFLTGITFDNVTGEIDALPTATIYRYEAPKNVGSFSEVSTGDEANGSLFWAQTLTTQVWVLNQEHSAELAKAAKGNPVIFVRDFQNRIFMMGRTEGTNFSYTAQTGTAKGDLNGYIINATAEEPNFAEQLEAYTTEPFDNFAGITVSPGELS